MLLVWRNGIPFDGVNSVCDCNPFMVGVCQCQTPLHPAVVVLEALAGWCFVTPWCTYQQLSFPSGWNIFFGGLWGKDQVSHSFLYIHKIMRRETPLRCHQYCLNNGWGISLLSGSLSKTSLHVQMTRSYFQLGVVAHWAKPLHVWRARYIACLYLLSGSLISSSSSECKIAWSYFQLGVIVNWKDLLGPLPWQSY